LNEVAWLNLFNINLYGNIVTRSPFIFVLGDNCVTCHM